MAKPTSPDQELSTSYSPNEIEDKWYPIWEKSGSFKPKNDDADSFTLMIPPPNVTGILTMGHVLNNSIQDVLVRRARMQGKNTLWLPGTDHASIATEAKVTRMLKDQGINKREISRDEFLGMTKLLDEIKNSQGKSHGRKRGIKQDDDDRSRGGRSR